MIRSLTVAALFVSAAYPQLDRLSAGRIRAHVKFLSSDLLEGRGPGTRGDQLATEYIATQFDLAGAKPAGDNGGWFQKVPLTGVTTQASAQLSASAGGRDISFQYLNEFVGVNQRQTVQDRFDAEAVFVGHGIAAPEWGWDDFKGADVKGKVIVLFTNEPPSNDPKFFDGRALTYYGRWTWKYEEATRRGALAALIIHTTPTAGYGWEVVRGSWARESPYVKLAPGEHALAFSGWLTKDAGEKLFSLAGRSVDEMLKAAESRDFRPIPLGIHIRADIPTEVREIDTRNVVAIVPGSDPKLASEAVIFSAHWDHLGIGVPVNGDNIYNGAIDNATGCGILLEMARAWAAQQQKPRRSALFIAVTAEEGGLRGSEYHAAHPKFPPDKTALDINFDAIRPFGRTTDAVITGAERTTMWPEIQRIARSMNLKIDPDPRPEQGSYFRSDHFAFARVGVPAFSVQQGPRFEGKPANYGEQVFNDYNEKHYHQPSDEFQESWDFSGLAQMAQFGFAIAAEAANHEPLPRLKEPK